MNKKLLTLAFALIVFSLPLWPIVNGRPLNSTLHDLSVELRTAFKQSALTQQRFDNDYQHQHQKLIDVITKSNELSILLYTQEQNMTFDLAYALQTITADYKAFNNDRRPYDRIVSDLTLEIDRYARLIDALQQLPPSLIYNNDTLDQPTTPLEHHDSLRVDELLTEILQTQVLDSVSAPFILDEEGKVFRDSCIFYASELMKMHADNRATVIADSTHYQEAFSRMEEANAYAQERYRELQHYVFIEGQTPFMEILDNSSNYWDKVKTDIRHQYGFSDFISKDTLVVEKTDEQPEDSTAVQKAEDSDETAFDGISRKGINLVLVVMSILQLVILGVVWALSFLVLWLIHRFFKPKHFVTMKKIPLLAILVGTIIYFMTLAYSWGGGEYIQLGVRHVNTFLWLLIAISGSVLLRVKPEQIWHGVQLYTPTIIIAFFIIFCRATFIPDRLMSLLFPPILFVIVLRQLFFCIKNSRKATPIDSTLGWVSFAIYLITFVIAFFGYTFASLLVLVWWYFQLAALLTIVCIYDLLTRYRERWMNKRVTAMRQRITYVTGEAREALLFGATWFYDLIREVVIPILVLLSLPACIRLSLNVFDFTDIFVKAYGSPFVQFIDKDGSEAFIISAKSIVNLLILLFVLRYFNRAIHTIWRYARYTIFMQKHQRSTIRANEINLSLANSIISVLVWMFYAMAVIIVWRVPTGSLGLVAGGLSAGIGLALKDIINNFIYGIQIMGGRLRVGDWIECEGVRGKVTAVNYQCVQVETIEGTEMSFLNASLFGKNFNNLTRNNAYELTTIIVGVAYGTDISHVRKVLVEGMQKMRTKDHYGREIVDPKYGIYVVVSNMSESSVDVAVKQYVLVAERIGYVDRAKEVIYESLNAAGIDIPFPQCDIHLVQ